MNKTESARYIEDVQGIIIGDFHSTGQLYYEDRPQGPRFNGSDEEIRQAAIAYAAKMKLEYGAHEYARLYPNGLTLRIWD